MVFSWLFHKYRIGSTHLKKNVRDLFSEKTGIKENVQKNVHALEHRATTHVKFLENSKSTNRTYNIFYFLTHARPRECARKKDRAREIGYAT